MKLETLIYGIYPKSEELRRSISNYEREKIGTPEIVKEFEKEKNELIERFGSSGISYFSDPILNWYDIFRPFSLMFTGFELGQLTRYKETNTFYRLPVVHDVGDNTIRYDRLLEGKENPPANLFSSSTANGHLAFFPGVHSFYAMSDIRRNISEEEFSAFVVKNYMQIMKRYGMRGAVIFDPMEYGEASLSPLNPLIEKYPVYLVTTGKLSKKNFAGLNGDLASIISDQMPGNIMVASENSKVPGIKAIDARNTLMESAEELKHRVSRVGEDANVERIIVANSESFDFLPRQIADRKTEVMAELGE